MHFFCLYVLYVLVATLSTQDNPELFQQLNLVLKEQLTGISIWSNNAGINQYFDYSTDSSFLGKIDFIVWKYLPPNKLQAILSSNCRNKILQRYD